MQCLGILFQVPTKFISEAFVERLVLNLLSAKNRQNTMLRNFVRSIDKSYQWHFPKVVVLKRSTKGAMRSSFRRAPCT